MEFIHLHVHSQYSILDGAASIKGLVSKAKEYGMNALALTDHGFMYGIKEFFNTARKEGIKPILGVEAYMAKNSRFDKHTERGEKHNYHLILLAKNLEGYHNLMKLVSYGAIEGMYYGRPRIDRELLEKYHKGLIVSSACLGGEIPQAILRNDIEAAKSAIEYFLDLFGDDFYLELMKHPSGDPEMDKRVYERQLVVNEALIKLAKEYNIKLIATNDVHFLNREDADAHDILLCISTKKDLDDPNRMRYTRQEYFKSPEQMYELFSEVPEALENTLEIADKVEEYDINRKHIMPHFQIPSEFKDDHEYLRHLVYEGAKERWGEITPKIKERLDFELNVIKEKNFSSYFLIVWDFIKAAREQGISVGPGRGSAAGAAISYALKITNIDPIRYNLLFERFLNPERTSMPDIDVDFDEDGRDKILEWVANKYGRKRVAHIITFGKMAPKMAIHDVARVLKVPLETANKLAKLVPDKPANMTFEKAYANSPELARVRSESTGDIRKVFEFAEILEGSVRQVGLHACGTIIGRDDLENFIPLTTHKDAKLLVTQYDGHFVEEVGLLKMDFLGLKTLSIIRDAVKNIEYSHGIKLDIDNIPLDDEKTYKLYSEGKTIGTFQFESDGMRKYLKALKPNRLEDLVAMNALYRPGPMKYIQHYIDRKHGREKVEYLLPEMEEYLAETYGITIYQEQVMLLSQKLAGFTKGEADKLRKAMGKKKKKELDEMKPKFFEGCKKNNIPLDKAEQIWNDWEAFASYAFNKSHATSYAFVAYQTAYLKAHYPAEYMAAVMSRNINNIDKISKLIEDIRSMGIKVMVPDINESYKTFTVTKEGNIRFGLAAIKGVGEGVVDMIIQERKKNGAFKDIYDFVQRVDLSAVNKRVFENLILSGAFDSLLQYDRTVLLQEVSENTTFADELLKFGAAFQQSKLKSKTSLFGEITDDSNINKPNPPDDQYKWNIMKKLAKEKELIGVYLSAHPLDNYKHIIEAFRTMPLADLHNNEKLKQFLNKDIIIAGVITEIERRLSKQGKTWAIVTIEDFTDTYKLALFSSQLIEYESLIKEGTKLFVKGTIQVKYNDPSQIEFRVKEFKPIENAKISYLALKLEVKNINDDLINTLHNVIAKNKGSVGVKFLIYDDETKVWVIMNSMKYKIKLSPELLNFINEKNIGFKLYGNIG